MLCDDRLPVRGGLNCRVLSCISCADPRGMLGKARADTCSSLKPLLQVCCWEEGRRVSEPQTSGWVAGWPHAALALVHNAEGPVGGSLDGPLLTCLAAAWQMKPGIERPPLMPHACMGWHGMELMHSWGFLCAVHMYVTCKVPCQHACSSEMFAEVMQVASQVTGVSCLGVHRDTTKSMLALPPIACLSCILPLWRHQVSGMLAGGGVPQPDPSHHRGAAKAPAHGAGHPDLRYPGPPVQSP